MMSPEAAAFRRRAGISETRVDDESFLVVPETEAIFHLNPMGRALWALLEAPRTRAALEAELAAAFAEVPRAEIARDVARFLDDLERAGLVEPVGDR